MLVKAKCSKNKEWGVLEKYTAYRYGNRGYIKAVTFVNVNGELSPVYVYKADEFISLDVIEKEVGIARYLKAKKPFYCKVKEGFLVMLKAEVNYETMEYIEDKSSFEVYTLNGTPKDFTNLPFKKVLDVPDEFKDIVREPLRVLAESFGDREKFLRSRVKWEE